MQNNTGDLLNRLNNAENTESLDGYLQSIDGQYPNKLCEYLCQVMEVKGISASELYKRSGIERTYCYQILNGRKNPGRDKIIAIAIALDMTLEETQRALEIACEGVLYVKSKRDSIIIYGINNKLNIINLNSLLKQYDEAELE